jgi:RHS repeat-associated protein
VTDSYAYDAYGSVISHVGPTQDNPYQYVGALGYYTHYQAPDFKLLQLGFRFYDPETGRFTQADPVGDGINWYAYCGGNPMGFTDPWGLDWLDNTSNFFAGWGDALTFGATGRVRMWLGVNDVVDEGSRWYFGGQVIGTAHAMALSGPRGPWKGGSNAWKATRAWLGKIGFAEKWQPMHHWGFRQAGWLGERFPGLTNQIWNLVPMTDKMHKLLHAGELGIYDVLRYGVPSWAKREAAYLGGRLIEGIGHLGSGIDEDGCP